MPQFEMSDREKAIRRCITHHIQDQNLAEDDGLGGKALVQLCLQKFYNEVQDAEVIKKEKTFIEDAIRRMIEDRILMHLTKDQKVVFRLDPYFNFKDKMNPSASQPTEDPQGTQEALEALDKEKSPDLEDQQQDDQEEPAEGRTGEHAIEQTEEQQEYRHDGQEEEQDDMAEAIRHSEAYAEMTRGAAPLPRAPSDENIETPSRKRRKVLEIAASDASSSFDPISPGRYANSTPRRTMKRLGTPLSGSRRRSAPTGMFNSPSKRISPRHTEQRLFKEERTDNSPTWLKEAVKALRSKYTGSSIISENGIVKCLDCEGRVFKPAGNHSLSNVNTHLKSRTHQDRAAHRQEKLGPTDSFFPTGVTSMDFNILQAPVTVFAQQGQQNLATLRNQYFEAMEREAHDKAIRTVFVESRVAEMQKKIKEQVDHVDASLRTFERKTAEQKEHMANILSSSAERHKELSGEVTDRVDSIQEKNEQQLQKMEARIATSEETSTSKLDDMNRILARSDHRNINQIENMDERIKEFEKKTEERLSKQIKDLERINEGQNETIHDLESQYQLLTEALQRREKGEGSFHKAMTDQMEAHLQQTEKQMAIFEQKITERFEEKIAEQSKIMQQQAVRIQKLEKTSTKVRSLEKKIEEQQEYIARFENVLPAILRDFQDLREYVDDIEHRTPPRQSVSPTKARVSIAT